MVLSKRNELRVHACPCYLSSRKKESDKNNREKVDIVLSQVIFFFFFFFLGGGGGGGGAFCYHRSDSFVPICSKIKCSLSLPSLMLWMKTALSDSIKV